MAFFDLLLYLKRPLSTFTENGFYREFFANRGDNRKHCMAIFIAIYRLVPILIVLKHIDVLVLFWWVEIRKNYGCHIGGSELL